MSAVPPFTKMYHGNHSFYQNNRHYSYCYNKTVASWHVHEKEDLILVKHCVLVHVSTLVHAFDFLVAIIVTINICNGLHVIC